jgi:membrane protease YdiL (CAAX protease family)
MQVLTPKDRIKEQPASTQAASAQLSLRAVTALEIASVLSSVFITVWAIIPLQPGYRWLSAAPALLAVALMINSHRVRGESLREIGLTTWNFWRALRLVIPPTLIACAIFVAIGYFAGSFHRTSHFWSNLLIAPVWALIQQYVLQGFVYRRVRFLLVEDIASQDARKNRIRLAILITAAIFSLTHSPNLMLMALTFAGGLIWSWVYERAPNLFAVGLSHAAISLMLMTSLPPWLLESMSVGYKHFLYQKF